MLLKLLNFTAMQNAAALRVQKQCYEERSDELQSVVPPSFRSSLRSLLYGPASWPIGTTSQGDSSPLILRGLLSLVLGRCPPYALSPFVLVPRPYRSVVLSIHSLRSFLERTRIYTVSGPSTQGARAPGGHLPHRASLWWPFGPCCFALIFAEQLIFMFESSFTHELLKII